jgi:hypothetical protein
MSWLDQKYVGLMSNQFDLFKKKGDALYNLRCPECGDSQKNKYKARGYLYSKSNKWFYKCHNCGYSVSLSNFMKKHSPILYKEYALERLSEGVSKGTLMDFTDPVEADEAIDKQEPVRGLWPLKKIKKISQLQWDHSAKVYIQSRQIPNPYHTNLYYTPNFAEWVNTMLPDKLNPKNKEKRIIIPLISKDNNLVGFQGRLVRGDGQRYITIILNERAPRVYGLDKANLGKHLYCFEGPFDSMFIPNSIAVCGSDMVQGLQRVDVDRSKVTLVFDNERRNPQIIKKIENAIDSGYNICLWPGNIEQKDVNEMVLSGKSLADIKLIIDSNTYNGLSAKMALSTFKRI